MRIDDTEFPITENLYAFMQRYRSSHALWYVWIDAVCINQSDLDEKAMQVDHMLVIYEKAELVMIWLGDEGPNTKLAVDYLHWAIRNSRETRDGEDVFNDHSNDCLQLVPQVLSGIEDMCSRNWVRRIWVKQEICAANKLIVSCGTHQLSWYEYRRGPSVTLASVKQVARDGIEYRGELQEFRPNISSEDKICLQNLRSWPDPSRPLDLRSSPNKNVREIMRLLNESTDCQATNTHDRIYALLGIAGIHRPGEQAKPAGSSMTIEIDYKIPMELLYSRIAMSVMLHAGPAMILATDGIYGAQHGIDLPSWTPDSDISRGVCSMSHSGWMNLSMAIENDLQETRSSGDIVNPISHHGGQISDS